MSVLKLTKTQLAALDLIIAKKQGGDHQIVEAELPEGKFINANEVTANVTKAAKVAAILGPCFDAVFCGPRTAHVQAAVPAAVYQVANGGNDVAIESPSAPQHQQPDINSIPVDQLIALRNQFK